MMEIERNLSEQQQQVEVAMFARKKSLRVHLHASSGVGWVL